MITKRLQDMIQYVTSYKYNIEHEIYYKQIMQFAETIVNYYPCYTDWLNNKFFYGLKSDTMRRGYVFAVDNNVLSGIALLKKDAQEKKICCLFVKPEYRKQGIATNLIRQSISLLQIDRPLITISEQNLSLFLPLFRNFGFEITEIKHGIYKKGIKEYYFNSK